MDQLDGTTISVVFCFFLVTFASESLRSLNKQKKKEERQATPNKL